MTTKAIHVIS